MAADVPVAPVNNAHKFFIANIDYQTTASQVKQFFSAFGNVNHVKLIPHSSSSSSNYTDDSDAARQRHKGYGFLFMLDDPSTLAVERYVNAFPENKIEMLGRKGVFVKRQVGMGREGGGRSSNTNVGRANTSSNTDNSDGGASYQYSWRQYLDYDAQQTQYNTNATALSTTASSGYGEQHVYNAANAANVTNYPQQPQAVTVQSSQGLSDYYALQPTYPQPQVQQHSQQLPEYVPAPQHLQYSSTPSSATLTSASSTTQYNQHQYPNDSNYAATYQANYAVQQQSSTQFVVQQQTIHHNPVMYAVPAPAVYINQPQLPPPTTTTLGYSQNSQLPLSKLPQQSGTALPPPPPPPPPNQQNRWEQWQQPQLPPQTDNHNPRSMQQPNYPLRGGGGVGSGGGKWNGGGMMSYNRGMGGGDGGGSGNRAGRGGGSGVGGAATGGGRNGRECRRDRPY